MIPKSNKLKCEKIKEVIGCSIYQLVIRPKRQKSDEGKTKKNKINLHDIE